MLKTYLNISNSDLFDLTESLVRNIKGLHHCMGYKDMGVRKFECVAKTQFPYLSFG